MRKMLHRSLMAAILVAGATSAIAADPFPSKPVRVVVASTAGGLLADASTIKTF